MVSAFAGSEWLVAKTSRYLLEVELSKSFRSFRLSGGSVLRCHSFKRAIGCYYFYSPLSIPPKPRRSSLTQDAYKKEFTTSSSSGITKRVMTNVSAANAVTCTNFPFGDGLSCTGNDRDFTHFTDDVHDSQSNLEHTWFRQYSTIQGRFGSTDPYSGSMDLGNPQSLNRYTYVSSDPMNYVDSAGLEAVKGPFEAPGCTLITGTEGEIFACSGAAGNVFGGGGGFSFGLLGPGFGGGGFGGITLPGCLLPGACSITLPSKSIWDLLPQLPGDQCSDEFGCQSGSEVGSGLLPSASGIRLTKPFSGLFGTVYCGPGPDDLTLPTVTGPRHNLDEACRAHDVCYQEHGFTPGSNFNILMSKDRERQLRACNQALCNASADDRSLAGDAINAYFSTVPVGECHTYSIPTGSKPTW